MRLNERYSIAGAAAILGLVFVVGLYGFLSLIGASPTKPLSGLRSEEEVVARAGGEGRLTGENGAPAESDPGPAAPEESPAADEPTAEPTPPGRSNPPAAALAVVAGPREARPNGGAQGQPQSTPRSAPPATPAPTATPQPAPNPTPAPTDPPITPAPLPDACSAGNGTPLLRQTGKHVRVEFATVVSFDGSTVLVETAGTVTLFRLNPLTVITGNLGAATLVRAEGHREGDGSVTAEVIEVICPDSARG